MRALTYPPPCPVSRHLLLLLTFLPTTFNVIHKTHSPDEVPYCIAGVSLISTEAVIQPGFRVRKHKRHGFKYSFQLFYVMNISTSYSYANGQPPPSVSK